MGKTRWMNTLCTAMKERKIYRKLCFIKFSVYLFLSFCGTSARSSLLFSSSHKYIKTCNIYLKKAVVLVRRYCFKRSFFRRRRLLLEKCLLCEHYIFVIFSLVRHTPLCLDTVSNDTSHRIVIAKFNFHYLHDAPNTPQTSLSV